MQDCSKLAPERIVLQAADYSIYHDILVANFIPGNTFVFIIIVNSFEKNLLEDE